MYCKHCGKQMNDNQAVCLGCGIEKGKGTGFCATCGNTVLPEAAVCPHCGVATKKPLQTVWDSIKEALNI